jgi:hypothetical protein
MKRSRGVQAVLAGVVLILSGCLSSTIQHFNTGETLPHGETTSTYGLARRDFINCTEPSKERNQEGFKECLEYQQMTVWLPSYTWALGVREAWGPFTGVEIGWMIEPLGTIDFNAKLGLPGLGKYPSLRHAVMAGWGIGMWADNTLFLEYAISHKTTDWLRLYASFRGSLVATGVLDLEMSDDNVERSNRDVFLSHQRFQFQNTLGMRFGPYKMPILPTYVDIALHSGAPVIMPLGTVPDKRLETAYPAFYNSIGFGLTW